MHSIPLSKISSINKELPLYLESIEGGSYLALTELDNERLPITDSNGNPIKGANLDSVRSALGGARWSSVSVLQRAAYDEMIGHPSEQNPVYEIPVSWNTDNT